MDFVIAKKLLFAANFRVSDKLTLEKAMEKYVDDYELNPHDFTETILRTWGCVNWDGETMLLPPWMIQFLPTDFVLYDINGKEAIIGKDPIDMDTRAGVVAFGVKFADLQQEEAKPEQADLDKVKQDLIDKLEKITGQKISGIDFE